MPRKHHDVKLAAKFYGEQESGRKNSEFRFNDRNYEVGDTITLKEWVPPPDGLPETRLKVVHGFTGRAIHREITHVLTNADFPPLPEDWVVLSMRPIDSPDADNVARPQIVTEGEIDPARVLAAALEATKHPTCPLRSVVVAGWEGGERESFYFAASCPLPDTALILMRAGHQLAGDQREAEVEGSGYSPE